MSTPFLKTLIVLTLLALLPLRALAAVTIGSCAMGQQGSAAVVPTGADEAATPHDCDVQPAKPSTSSCKVCVEHCSSATFAPSIDQPTVVDAGAQGHGALAERVAPAFISDQLDRPPLA